MSVTTATTLGSVLSMALMKVNKRLWVDPSEGRRWGFPKIWEPEKDGNLRAWLIRNGYPEVELKRSGGIVRQWDAKENE